MGDRGDLLSCLRSVDEILADARPRAPREAQLLAKLRAADRARQAPSSSSPSPSLLLAARRPLGVTAALCGAFALALALRAGDHAQRSTEASTSRGDEAEALALALALDRDPEATQLSSTKSAPRPRAVAPQPRAMPRVTPRERRPTTTTPPALLEAPQRRAPWDDALPSPSPQLSSSDDSLLRSDTWPPARRHGEPAPSAFDEPRVLWAEGRSEATAKLTSTPARRGQAPSSAPLAEPRPDGCEPAESLIDRARADCESQALTLSESSLATLDACGDDRFRGLDYACAPAQHTSAPPSSKAPAGCFTVDLPPDGACKTEDDTRLEALQWCEDAGLTLAGLLLDQGACSDGVEGAHLLCCEKDADESQDKSLPRVKQACSEDTEPDCTP
jgi:hypothetical protein